MPQVEEYRIGNTTIRIMGDAFAGKSQREIEEILRRIGRRLGVSHGSRAMRPLGRERRRPEKAKTLQTIHKSNGGSQLCPAGTRFQGGLVIAAPLLASLQSNSTQTEPSDAFFWHRYVQEGS